MNHPNIGFQKYIFDTIVWLLFYYFISVLLFCKFVMYGIDVCNFRLILVFKITDRGGLGLVITFYRLTL